MTEIEKQALALVNEVISADQLRILPQYVDKAVLCEALCRTIEQHEQFKREVSDAVEAFFEASGFDATKGLIRFILPKPVDPLVEAYQACFPEDTGIPSICAMLQAEITKRGGRIVWENEP